MYNIVASRLQHKVSLMKRRSKMDIIIDILEILYKKDSCTKTEIVYRANLNFKVAEIYLTNLIKNGLITINGSRGSKKYSITRKGKSFYENAIKFLSLYREIFKKDFEDSL